MEHRFSSNALSCLRTVRNDVKTQELTQEIKAEEDVGRILSCYGQVIVRGKEWKSDCVEVNGGVMAWVLYLPENGDMPKTLEAWLPFNIRWDLQGEDKEGFISVTSALDNAEARLTGAGKVSVRAKLSLRAEITVEETVQIPVTEKLPEGVEILNRTLLLTVPGTYGEKVFTVEEKPELPGPEAEKIFTYGVRLGISDCKILGGRLLIRGTVTAHILYLTVDGVIHGTEVPIRFSQIADTDAVGEDAVPRVQLCISALELDQASGALKVGIVCQYVLMRKETVSLPIDGYSTREDFTPITSAWTAPAVLDSKTDSLEVDTSVEAEAQTVADACFWCGIADVNGVNGSVEIGGHWSLLYYDSEGRLQAATKKWSCTKSLSLTEGVKADMDINNISDFPASADGTRIKASCKAETDILFTTAQNETVLTGFRTEPSSSEEEMPGIVICRAGERSLWSLAKEYKTTVDAICGANNLDDDSVPDKMLLIPS